MNLTKRFRTPIKVDYSLLGVMLIFVASFAVMSIALYKSEVIFNGFNRSHYYIYFLFSFVGIFLSVALCFVSKKIRVETVLVSVALLVGIYTSEFALGFISHDNGKLTERKYLDSLLKNNSDVVPRLLPGFFVGSNGVGDKNKIFPLAGISNKLTIHCNESGEMITYISDRYGFNNPDSVWTNNPVLITIGDSFTQGDCVPQSNTIASNLRNTTKKNVINLGMGGNGPLIEFATLVEYGKRVKPQYVLWIFFEGNDLFELATEQQSDLLLSYLKGSDDQSLIDRQAEIDSALLYFLKSRDHDRDRYTISNFLMLKRVRGLLLSSLSHGVPTRDFDSIWPLMHTVLIEAKKITESWGGKFVFVYLPSYARFSGDVLDQDRYLDKAVVIEKVGRLQIPVIDIYEVFLRDKDPLRFFPHRKNGHYNEAGYLMVSRSLAEKLQLNIITDR
jgi:hypothetical protein